MSLELIQTRAAKAKLCNEFSAIVYEPRKKKIKPAVKPNLKPQTPTNKNDLKANKKNESTRKDVNELDMNKMRHEIIKFGMTGLDELEKQNTKVALAIKLGAKPPKRKYINYKELQKEQKAKKLAEDDGLNQTSGIDKPSKFSMKQLRHATPNQLYGQILKNYGVVDPTINIASSTVERHPKKFNTSKRVNTNRQKGGPAPKRKK